jgi:DNA-binding transcriptional regulator YhcF (GntR family)
MFGRGKQEPSFNPMANFTDRLKRVLELSREEAIGLRHDYVGTEHLLLGLLAEREGVHAAVFMNANVDARDVRARVLATVKSGQATIALGALPYTGRAKKTLEYAIQSAREMGFPYVGTEHLILGLLLEQTGIGGQVLKSVGLDVFLARKLIVELLELNAEPSGAGPIASFRIDIDDASDKSIYEQIIHQIQEAVATGKLRPGDRLAPVRQLADQLNIAPGTVARAYSELERLKVVVTEGARGTRIAERAGAPEQPDRTETLTGLLRPVAVAAFHMGASSAELRGALERAMSGIFDP